MQLLKGKKYFIYFVLAAPVLAKFLEWTIQSIFVAGEFELFTLLHALQLFFIVSLAFISYSVMFEFMKKKRTIYNFALVPTMAYLLKELYNFAFVVKFSMGTPMLIALTIEPLVVYFLIGIFIPALIWSIKLRK